MPKPSYDDKNLLIDNILAQDTYLPESDLMKSLKRALNKLSYSDLANLQVVLQLRINQEATITSRIANTMFADLNKIYDCRP